MFFSDFASLNKIDFCADFFKLLEDKGLQEAFKNQANSIVHIYLSALKTPKLGEIRELANFLKANPISTSQAKIGMQLFFTHTPNQEFKDFVSQEFQQIGYISQFQVQYDGSSIIEVYKRNPLEPSQNSFIKSSL